MKAFAAATPAGRAAQRRYQGVQHSSSALTAVPVFRQALLVSAALAAIAPAQAFEFTLDDQWSGAWNTTLSAGMGWRMERRDAALIAPTNQPGATGGDANSDDGDLNYGRGQAFTKVVKVVSELAIKRGKDFGGFIRGAGLHDFALKDGTVAHGNTVNGYAANQPLSDNGFFQQNKFSTAYLLDAYLWGNTDLGGAKLNTRLGRQVVSWGESMFIPGVNASVPVSVPALRRPGTELKEAFLPTNQLFASLGLPSGQTVEGFYQLGYQRTVIDGCGTYMSNADFLFDPSCGPVIGNSPVDDGTTLANPANFLTGALVQRLSDVPVKKGGQWGLALRQRVDALDTDFGAYYSTFTSRSPIVSSRVLAPLQMTPGGPVVPSAVQVEYPDRIRLLGLSASTAFGAWQVGTEYSYSPNFPIGINGMDMALSSTLLGPMAGAKATAAAGDLIHGYSRVKKHQLQANFVRLFNNVAGANYMALVGEAAYQQISGMQAGVRYGRATNFGFSAAGQTLPPPIPGCFVLNANADGCGGDGFATRSSWGYRMLASLTYSGVVPGFTFTPRLAWNHDVRGHSGDGQTFIQGRRSVSTGLQTVYLNDYSFDVAYTRFINSRFDPLRDRDYLTVAASVSF